MELKYTSIRVLYEIRSRGNTPCGLTYFADTLGLCHKTVEIHTARLERLGMITRTRAGRGVPYTYRITEKGERALG